MTGRGRADCLKAKGFLDAAGAIIADRAETHGAMLRNHRNIATMWSAFLNVLGHPVELTPAQACEMLQLLKLARRHEGGFNPDDDLDDLGYGAIRAVLRSVEQEQRLAADEERVQAVERRARKAQRRNRGGAR